jgi:hypothetical protein
MGQKLWFRAARHPCVIVRSTPVSRPSKGGPAWLFRAITGPEQVQQIAWANAHLFDHIIGK